MKRFTALLVLSVLALGPRAVRAQESVATELEFVQQLRAKGYSALAKEYLDQMAKRGDPKIMALLPLEQARTMIALAREKDAEQRAALFAAARIELQRYIKANTGKVEAAEASFELARLSAYHGQALLTRALREEETKAQHDRARPAEAMFQQAGKDLTAAVKALEAAQASYKNSDTAVEKQVKARLAKELTRARFEQGINLIEQARTYIDTGKEAVNKARAEVITQAQKVFASLSEEESSEVGALANAWLMKIAMEQQDPPATAKYYKRVISQKGKDAQAAHRWARLFWMQNYPRDPTVSPKVTLAQKLNAVEKEGKAWLSAYPAHVKSPEGQAVLFELANTYYAQAQSAEQKKAAKTVVANLYGQAQKYYGRLAALDGDLSEKAKQLNLALSFQLMGKRTTFRTFDELYLKGLYERYKVVQAATKLEAAAGKERETLEKKRKEHLREVIKALNRAISLSDAHTPVAKLDDARFYLTGAYLTAGDLARAAIAGEGLARSRPPTRRSPSGAAAALEAYAALLARDPSDGTRQRLNELAEYVLSPDVQKFWGGDPVSGLAHYQLAMLANRDNRYADAIGHLSKLPADFPGYLYSQGQLVFIAQEAREKAKNDTEKRTFEQSARAALARMKELPKDADPSTAAMYFFAKMELSKFLYSDAAQILSKAPAEKKVQDAAVAKYIEMAKYLDGLRGRFVKLPIKLTPTTRDKIAYSLDVMGKYADLGLADVEFRRGRFEKVIAETKPVVDRVLADAAKAKGGAPIRYADYQVTGDVLGLALRAYVQKGNIDMGKKLLDAVKRLAPKDESAISGAVSGNVVRNLLTEIAVQIDTLRKAKNTEALKAMVGNYTSFLDVIATEYAKKGFDLDSARLLANAYQSLDQYVKAADVFGKFPAPKYLEEKRALTKEEQDAVGLYWFMQVQRAKALRQAGGAERLKDANKVLDRLLTHHNAKNQVLAQMEKYQVLEDQGLYAGALQLWLRFMKNPALRSGGPEVQKLYFDGYYFTQRALYLYATKDAKVPEATRARYVRVAAANILKLEFANDPRGWELVGPKFQELLTAEPELRRAYDELKPKYEKSKK